MRVFVVKHLPTGKFLPPIKSCKPATRQELSETPRIFYRTGDAVAAARWWARGSAHMEYITDWETGQEEPLGPGSIPIEGRKLEDLRLCDASVTILRDMESTIEEKA